MTKQQNKLTNILKWFHNFCEKNGIRYYIIAGTMLGAVRHKGFIPWDDDIDVGVPRKDYEKLRLLSSQNFDKNYVFEFPGTNNKEFPYLFAKLYDKNTTLVEKQRYPIKRGIYIDIFPLDGVGNTIEESKVNYKPFYRLYKLRLAITTAFLKRRSLKKNMVVFAGRLISPLFVSRHRLASKIDKLCKRIDFDDADYVCNLLGGAGVSGIVPKEYFGVPTPIEFEGITVYGLQNPDLYLKSMYKNYMELPPVEKQVSLHDVLEIDLDKPFEEN